jgi:hypothetical protein
MVCLSNISANTLHKGDTEDDNDNDNDNNSNNNNHYYYMLHLCVTVLELSGRTDKVQTVNDSKCKIPS